MRVRKVTCAGQKRTRAASVQQPGMDAEEPMAEPEDDFGAAEPAAGGEEEAGRAKRESIQRSVRLGQILSSKKK